MPLFGAHMSISGGLHLAFARLARVDGEALQIFTANQRQWRVKEPTPEEVGLFKETRAAAGSPPVASHDSYLINLASPKAETEKKSLGALAGELRRCAALEIEYLIMHPGSHLGAGIEAGIERFTANLDLAVAEADSGGRVMILLEITAGQGTSLGSSFGELAGVIARSRYPQGLGVCFDTCHAFAAGYDLRTPETYRRTMAEFDAEIGLDRLRFFHLNDATKELGSRIDRHTHIGKGWIGTAGFRNLVNDPRFARHPMVLETPKSEDLHEDRENLAVLRDLLE
ncbi:MAG: deoxyribonuclease IV [Desulfurivibrionaceae bacterium]|nr:deoxyribonuclease IV [Desulfurivibrionaceae bacterium]